VFVFFGEHQDSSIFPSPMSMWSSKALKQLQGHRWVRATSDWVIRRTNSKTVSAWLMIDLFISLALGMYYFFFRYVPALGVAPFAFMRGFKFFIVVATFRAACTTWGILSVLFRNVRQVKLFYTVFIINLLVAVWLMIPVLSLHCKCSDYYQCEALQSFAMDGLSLNKLPEPESFGEARKVPYEVAPSSEHRWPPPTTSTTTTTKAVKEEKPQTPQDAKEIMTQTPENKETNVAKAKDMAEETQKAKAATNAQNAAALIQRTDHAGEEAHDHSELSLEDLISMGHSRVVSKRRQRNKRVEASLLQMESSGAAALKKDDPGDGSTDSDALSGKPADEQQDEMNNEVLAILEGKIDNVLYFFNEKGGGKLKLEPVRGKKGLCASDSEKVVSSTWNGDLSRMELMGKGKEEKDHDPTFLRAVQRCLAQSVCKGIFWTVEKDDGPNYNSTACTIIGATNWVDKDEAELHNDRKRSVYLEKNPERAKELAKELASNPKAKEKLEEMACDAKTDANVVECNKYLYNNRCRCDAKKSCLSYTERDTSSERGWCYIDSKTLDMCWESKEVFKDSNQKPFTYQICEQAEMHYSKSCQCSGIGMLPRKGLKVDKDLTNGDLMAYGSKCEKWNGDDNKFRWCFVGWDSSCVDRERGDKHHSYQDANVPAQFWSHLACDDDPDNKRLKTAEDRCENLEYAVDGVCLVHLFLSVPMIMVLYNYISNRCGDDIQTVAQFAVESSSDDEDMPAGQTRKSNDSTASFAKATPPVPAFEGATESH